MMRKAAALRCAEKLRPQMGRAGELLGKILQVTAEDGSANLATVLRAVYPRVEKEAALASLRQFRLALNRDAAAAEMDFRLVSDTKTRSEPRERKVWFEGEDPLANEIEAFNAANVKGGPEWLPQSAIQLGPKLLYVVYADADKADAGKLLKALSPHLTNANLAVWHEGSLLAGEEKSEQRRKAQEDCLLRVELLSPHFYAAKLDEDRAGRLLPVLLHDLPKDRAEPYEIYLLKGKSFAKSRAAEFALGLIEQITNVLAKPDERGFERLARHGVRYIESSASSLSLAQDLEAPHSSTEKRDVMALLNGWLLNPNEPQYCALFGELGMGKTTNAKEFSQRLWARRKAGEKLPESVFLDLRNVGEYGTERPDLDQILARILKANWKGSSTDVLDIRTLAREGGLVIFDGLDEVLVHLTTQQGQQFTRQLLGIVPPGSKQGRVLITCRTHYFRTFKEQASHFRLEGRDNVKGEDYRAFLLLPFDEQQIRAYLKNSFPDSDPEAMWEFISTVHNLPELAQRPYTLSLIAQQFAKLEKWKAEGNPVTGLTLYRFVVEEWLMRDNGKHQILPEHKQMLMEHVAAELVRSGLRSWSASQLEQWLMDFLDANRRVASHYDGKLRELLKEDLRTATFLVREETGDQFRFAHSSLQEYFLAQHLRRALEAEDSVGWALRGVGRETLDFLGQSLLESPSAAAMQGLRKLHGQYHAGASEQAFRFSLIAHYKKYPHVPLAGFQLSGADLFGYEIGDPAYPQVDLKGVNLCGARLGNTYWRNCRLTHADFSGADAGRAGWHDCDLSSSRWGECELEGALFRQCELGMANFSDARTNRTHWLRCENGKFPEPQRPRDARERRLQLGHLGDVYSCAWAPDSSRVVSASRDDTLRIWDARSGDCLLTLAGHSDSVFGCAWAFCGSLVLSASSDKTLKIWDARSADCLLTLTGHSDSVRGCAWASDDSRVLSASDDNTLKIWDAHSGECLLTLAGHSNSVVSCCWAPDDSRVLSASRDKTLKIWDARGADCLLTLTGHSDSVWGCAWASDGLRVLSASADKTLKIWDAHSGECLLTLAGHSNSVVSCSWAADGSRVLSASHDKTLKIWDARSADCLLTLLGHSQSVWGCAWAPGSSRVLSASHDQTLKIWTAHSGDCLLTLTGSSAYLWGCSWASDGSRVLSASADHTLRIWDARSGAPLLTLAGHSDPIGGCAWAPDGSRVLSASADKTLKIWDAHSADCLLTLLGHSDSVKSCVWAPDSSRVLSASFDKTLKIWDARSGNCLLSLAGHSDTVWGCAWAPDGSRVLSASHDDTLKIWDAHGGHCLLTLASDSDFLLGCAFAPDGSRVVSAAADNKLKIWDAYSGACLLTLAGHSGYVNCCAFAPDGSRVVSASADNTLKIWDAYSGACLLTLAGHSDFVWGCAWAPDGSRVLSASSDGSLRIWDAETGVECGNQCWHLQAPRCPPSWATVDPVTKRVVNYGEDAWRSVGYVVQDEKGMPVWVPVEAMITV